MEYADQYRIRSFEIAALMGLRGPRYSLHICSITARLSLRKAISRAAADHYAYLIDYKISEAVRRLRNLRGVMRKGTVPA